MTVRVPTPDEQEKARLLQEGILPLPESKPRKFRRSPKLTPRPK